MLPPPGRAAGRVLLIDDDDSSTHGSSRRVAALVLAALAPSAAADAMTLTCAAIDLDLALLTLTRKGVHVNHRTTSAVNRVDRERSLPTANAASEKEARGGRDNTQPCLRMPFPRQAHRAHAPRRRARRDSHAPHRAIITTLVTRATVTRALPRALSTPH